jgi:hypothetical protein
MRVLVCGGRGYHDYARVKKILDAAGITELCHGGAAGADNLAGRWAEECHVPCQVFPADWGRWGKSAGPTRNVQMLVDFKPEMVIAFPGQQGTRHMIKIAREAGVDVVIVPESWISEEP